MTMKKWIELNGIGELYIEETLVYFDVPLLFVCKDTKDERYLILCVDEEEGQYLCSPITNEWLLKLLKNELPMADIFKQPSNGDNIWIDYDFEKSQFNNRSICIDELTAEILPDEGAYFDLWNDKIANYINILSLENFKFKYAKYNTLCHVRREFTIGNSQRIQPREKGKTWNLLINNLIDTDVLNWGLYQNSYSIVINSKPKKNFQTIMYPQYIEKYDFEYDEFNHSKRSNKKCLIQI